MKKELPLLLTEAQVKKILGRVPRSLENMVLVPSKNKSAAQKLFLRSQVMELCNG